MTVFIINVLLGSIYIIMGMKMIITCHLLFYYVPLKNTIDESSIHPFSFINYSNTAHLYNSLCNLHNKNNLDWKKTFIYAIQHILLILSKKIINSRKNPVTECMSLSMFLLLSPNNFREDSILNCEMVYGYFTLL